MPPIRNPYTRGRSTTKKALLVGISYANQTDENGQKLDPIPTSIPNVKKFKAFLQGELSLPVPDIPNLRAFQNVGGTLTSLS